MKVLLLSFYANSMVSIYEEPGIGYIAAYLRKSGITVELDVARPAAINYDMIRQYSPELIGISMYNTSKEAVFEAGKEIKKRFPKVKICVGGYCPSFLREEILLTCPSIDFVIFGEGEQTMLELVQALENGTDLSSVQGLIYRRKNMVKINQERTLFPQIKDLPWPARDLTKRKLYNISLILSARGCTSNCSFCLTKQHWKKWRGRDPVDVVNEIEFIHKSYGIYVFYFIDCSFENPGINYKRTKEITQKLIKRKLPIFYYAFMRSDFFRGVSPDLMQQLKESGMIGAVLGIESANQRDLSLYGKTASVEDNHTAACMLDKYGIHMDVGFIMFNPFSTFEGLFENISFLEKYQLACNVDYWGSLYAMYKGCSLNQKIIESNLVYDKENLYGYHFENPLIEKMALYAFSYNKSVQRESMQIRSLLTIQAYWEQIFEKQEKYAEAIMQTSHIFAPLKAEFNSAVSTWFKALLALDQDGWNQNEADRLTDKIFSNRYIRETASKLSNEHLNLKLKLSRLGLDLTSTPFIEKF